MRNGYDVAVSGSPKVAAILVIGVMSSLRYVIMRTYFIISLIQWPFRHRTNPNRPLPVSATIKIKRFIAARERYLNLVDKEIEEERNQLQICANAISNLKISIPEGKQALEIHHENLTALKGVRSRINAITAVEAAPMQPEPRSEELYLKMRTNISGPIIRGSDGIKEQIDLLEAEWTLMSNSIRDLEAEPEDQNGLHDASTTILKKLEGIRKAESGCIMEAKRSITPIWKVPFDVWRAIFKLSWWTPD